jgi:RNA 2',3'-cyclic 3'-phosphodiesterase
VSSARLFVALELPAADRAALAGWSHDACAADPALRAVAEEALHVTVHFLGERPEDDIAALRWVIAGAPVAAVPLASAGVLWLAPRRPHVLTLGLEDPSGALAALHRALGPLLEAATPGFRRATRALRPHVTVARVQRGARPREEALPEPPELSCEATGVVLLRSRLSPAGAVYEPLERRSLHRGA